MKKLELKQLIKEVIQEMDGAPKYWTIDENIKFDFRLILTDTNSIQGVAATAEKYGYSKEDDAFKLAGTFEYDGNYKEFKRNNPGDRPKGTGKFQIIITRFMAGNKTASCQTNGAVKGHWGSNDLWNSEYPEHVDNPQSLWVGGDVTSALNTIKKFIDKKLGK
jgi:hypothetical protein